MEYEATRRERRTRRQSTAGEDADVTASGRVQTLYTRVFWCCLALMLLLRLTNIILELPLLRLVEQIICKAYLDTDVVDIDEQACKIPEVQDKVAKVMGYRTTFDALPCMADAPCIYLFLLIILSFFRPFDCCRIWVILEPSREEVCDSTVAHRSIHGVGLDLMAW